MVVEESETERDPFESLHIQIDGGLHVELPPVSTYLQATAGHILHASAGRVPRREQEPTELELVCGPLLEVTSISRDEIHRLLAAELGLTPAEVEARKYGYRPSHRKDKLFPDAPFHFAHGDFSVKEEALPTLRPEDVQQIVRQAAHWWTLDRFDYEIDHFVDSMKEEIGLTALESEMLDAIIRRKGARLFINATSLELKQNRRSALKSLAQKLKDYFREDMILAEPCDRFEALEALLSKLGLPSDEDILLDHESVLGDHLPVSTLLLNGKLPSSKLLNPDPAIVKERFNAVEASLQHLRAMRRLDITQAPEEINRLKNMFPLRKNPPNKAKPAQKQRRSFPEVVVRRVARQ